MKIIFPDELRQVLAEHGPLCMAAETDQGGVVILLKTEELHLTHENVPIIYQYEMSVAPEGAGIRLYLEIYDRLEAPFQAETFFNPASQADLILLQELCRQDHLDIHVVNTALEASYTKRVRQSRKVGAELHQLVHMAVQYNSLIPDEALDFEMVKRRHQAARHIPA